MIAATRQAIIDGIACSPSSGFHHAGFDYNGAFCTFNGLLVAVQALRGNSTFVAANFSSEATSSG